MRDACFEFELALLLEDRSRRFIAGVSWRFDQRVLPLLGPFRLDELEPELLRGYAAMLRAHESEGEAEFTLQHLAWALAGAGCDLEAIEHGLGISE